jgi:molybdopterin converting factor small subunit
MQITVRLLASYRRYLPKDHDAKASYLVEIPPGSRLDEALADLPIPPKETYTFLLNGHHAGRDRILRPGDVLAVFPAVGGG